MSAQREKKHISQVANDVGKNARLSAQTEHKNLESFVKEIKARTLMIQSEDPFFDMSVKPRSRSTFPMNKPDFLFSSHVASTPAKHRCEETYPQGPAASNTKMSEESLDVTSNASHRVEDHSQPDIDDVFIRGAVAEELQGSPATHNMSVSSANSTSNKGRTNNKQAAKSTRSRLSLSPSAIREKDAQKNSSTRDSFLQIYSSNAPHASSFYTSLHSAPNIRATSPKWRNQVADSDKPWKLEAENWREVALRDKQRFTAQISRLEAEVAHAKGGEERMRILADRNGKDAQRLKDEVSRWG
jgi:hypothetical protein